MASEVSNDLRLTLAKIRINPRANYAANSVRNADSLHKILMGIVPDDIDDGTEPGQLDFFSSAAGEVATSPVARSKAKVLYRLERDRSGHTILMQAAVTIDETKLPGGYASSFEKRDMNPLINWVLNGHQRMIRYRIDANATIRIQLSPESKKRKNHWLSGDRAIEWWVRRSEAAGLSVHLDTLQDQHMETVKVWKSEEDEGEKRHVKLNRVRFEGTATISDPEKLCSAIADGIGRGRPYGLGLLSVAPLSGQA